MSHGQPPSTDVGTVLLHWLVVALFAVLLATGLRIAATDPALPGLRLLDPILPADNLWYWHLIAGAGLAAALVAYAVYVVRARLAQRVRLDWARFALLLRSGRPRWAAANVIVVWALLAALSTEIVTGIALFLDAGGPWLALHLYATWALLALMAAHVAAHWGYGGALQLLRIVKPARLVMAPPPPDLAELLAEQLELRDRDARAAQAKPGAPAKGAPAAPPKPARQGRTWPLVTAVAVAAAVPALALGFEQVTRVSLPVKAIDRADAPRLDGDLSDPVWSRAPVVSVLTEHGGTFGGTGESLVEIRAVHDKDFVYFAFVWTDPTRSLKHLPLVKRTDGWYVAQTRHDIADETEMNEDKFAVLFAHSALQLIGAAIHLARAPLPDKPPSLTGRGLHYTPDGSVADVWLWRASHAGLAFHVDNCHFGGPAEPTAAQADGRERYAGGFARDPAPPAYRDNFAPQPPGGYLGPVLPRRLPANAAAMTAAMGRIEDDPEESDSEGARWWMTEEESVPYSPQADSGIAVGTVIPGVIMLPGAREDTASVRGVARWAAGRWVLEMARRLDTGSKWDLPIATGLLMWVAAFDHSETRHTWHIRPIRLEVE
jgi:cytochrome b subunit of formate dehydrogenase